MRCETFRIRTDQKKLQVLVDGVDAVTVMEKSFPSVQEDRAGLIAHDVKVDRDELLRSSELTRSIPGRPQEMVIFTCGCGYSECVGLLPVEVLRESEYVLWTVTPTTDTPPLRWRFHAPAYDAAIDGLAPRR